MSNEKTKQKKTPNNEIRYSRKYGAILAFFKYLIHKNYGFSQSTATIPRLHIAARDPLSSQRNVSVQSLLFAVQPIQPIAAQRWQFLKKKPIFF